MMSNAHKSGHNGPPDNSVLAIWIENGGGAGYSSQQTVTLVCTSVNQRIPARRTLDQTTERRMKHPIIMSAVAAMVAAMAVVMIGGSGGARAESADVATRYSLAANLGQSYSPGNEIGYLQLAAAAVFDYDRVWPHRAPEALRFKVEGSAGVTTSPRCRALLSANMLALYVMEPLATPRFRPYLEAGIGIIYSDFRVEKQHFNINFNPQIGIGTEIAAADGGHWFVACRLHHISNGGLHKDNHGINSVLLQSGRFF